jgi:hypothetical protein
MHYIHYLFTLPFSNCACVVAGMITIIITIIITIKTITTATI